MWWNSSKSYDPNLREYHYDSDSSDENSDRYNDIFPEEDNDDVECNNEHNEMEQKNNLPTHKTNFPVNSNTCTVSPLSIPSPIRSFRNYNGKKRNSDYTELIANVPYKGLSNIPPKETNVCIKFNNEWVGNKIKYILFFLISYLVVNLLHIYF